MCYRLASLEKCALDSLPSTLFETVALLLCFGGIHLVFLKNTYRGLVGLIVHLLNVTEEIVLALRLWYYRGLGVPSLRLVRRNDKLFSFSLCV